jgi:hypothetical protein
MVSYKTPKQMDMGWHDLFGYRIIFVFEHQKWNLKLFLMHNELNWSDLSNPLHLSHQMRKIGKENENKELQSF